MRLEDALERFPWRETYDTLCADPPTSDQVHSGVVQAIVERLQDNQVPSLLRIMFSPVLDTRASKHHPTTGAGETFYRLRNPRRTARLFIERLASSGKDLRQFTLDEVRDLDQQTFAAASFVRLIAIARELSFAERRAQFLSIEQMDVHPDAYGVVLGAMIPRSEPAQEWHREGQLTETLASAVSAHLERVAGRPKSQRDYSELATWTRQLAREGAGRIEELFGRIRQRSV